MPAKKVNDEPQGYEPHDSSLNLRQRLRRVMIDVDYVQRKGKMQGQAGNYTFVTHNDVVAAVRPALIKHGVLVMQSVLEHEMSQGETRKSGATPIITVLTVETQFFNVDTEDEPLRVVTVGYGVDTGDKGPGKAMSYAAKYALLKALALETGDDADTDRIEVGNVVPMTPREPGKQPAPQDATMRAFWACAKSAKVDEDGAHAYAHRHYAVESLKSLSREQLGEMLTWVKGLHDAKRRLATQMTAAGVDPERELQTVLDTFRVSTINELTLAELADAAKTYSHMADADVPWDKPQDAAPQDDPYGGQA